jgi:serine/threonine-protein phosphatase 6 regulatory ankyrin repeat subunit B
MEYLERHGEYQNFWSICCWSALAGAIYVKCRSAPSLQNVFDPSGWAACSDIQLCDAARGGELEWVREQVADGVDVDWQDRDGRSALMWAAANGNAAVVEALVTAGAALDLQMKGGSDSRDYVKWTNGMTALMVAAMNGHAAGANVLVEAGAEIDLQDEGGFTALILAAREGRAAIAEALVEAGAWVDLQDKEGETALAWASDDSVRDLLRSAGAKWTIKSGGRVRDSCDAIPLCDAARNGELERVRELIADGADVDEQDKSGWTALMRAAADGYAAVVEALLQAGAQVDQHD